MPTSEYQKFKEEVESLISKYFPTSHDLMKAEDFFKDSSFGLMISEAYQDRREEEKIAEQSLTSQ